MALKGTVKGRYVDTAGNPVKGKIVFTPTPKRLLDLTAEPPETILPDAVAAVLDDGQFELELIATDDPALNPEGWTYRVQFVLSGGKTLESFPIAVPAGSVVDMAEATPVALSGGTPIVRGPGLPDTAGAADGQVVVLVDGVPTWGTVAGGGGGGGLDAEAVRDLIGQVLVPGPNVTVAVDDAANTVTISAAGGGVLDVEGVRDAVGAALREGDNIDLTVNDAGDTITIAVTGVVKNLGGAGGLWSGTQAEYDALSSTAGVHLIVEA